MDFGVLCTCCLLSASAATLIWVIWRNPTPLLQTFVSLGYWFCGLHKKRVHTRRFEFVYFERDPRPSGWGGGGGGGWLPWRWPLVSSAAGMGSGIGTEEARSPSSNQPLRPEPETLVFLHGYSGNCTLWLNLVWYLPKSWRIILLELPGHGESSFVPKEDYSVFGFPDILNEFIEGLCLKNFHLVGISLGAGYCYSYASKYILKSMILMCPPGTDLYPNGVTTEYLHKLDRGENLVLPLTVEGFREMMRTVLFDASMVWWLPHWIARGALDMRIPCYPNFRKIQDDLVDERRHVERNLSLYRTKMEKICCGVFLLWGKEDKIFDFSGAEICRRLLKNAFVQVETLSNCGHVIPLEKPKLCAALMQKYLSKHKQ